MGTTNSALGNIIETDVLILGSGAAGCGAAIAAREKGATALLLAVALVTFNLLKIRTPDPEEAPAPEIRSLAVLPFDNLMNDPGQDYFVEGMHEALITDLSKVHNLFVIARNSSFTYKDKAVNVQDVGREMGVKYVLEGSVRKAGGHVRVTAQLVDASNGGHIWADRYDRELQDIFALQDEVTQTIVTTLAVKIGRGERERLHRQASQALSALAERQLRNGQVMLAQATARRHLALEPWSESAHRQLIAALAQAGGELWRWCRS